jgi:hypothetical protein
MELATVCKNSDIFYEAVQIVFIKSKLNWKEALFLSKVS